MATASSSLAPRANTRAATTARNEILQQLKDDHRRVEKAYKAFRKLDPYVDARAIESIVEKVCGELSIHAALEEEMLYPAAHGALLDDDLIDEAEIEHETVHTFIHPLSSMRAGDDKYCARFTVLCEYVLHHVKEEEGEIFPKLESARVDWESLSAEMRELRAQLTPDEEEDDTDESDETNGVRPPDPTPDRASEDEDADPVGARVGGRVGQSTEKAGRRTTESVKRS
jgi:hemerythrin superfamily protein